MPKRQCNLNRNMKCRHCGESRPITLVEQVFNYRVHCPGCGTMHLVDFDPSLSNPAKPGRMVQVRVAAAVSAVERKTYTVTA